MFTPITLLSPSLQREVLASLDVPAEWEATWDIGLADVGDSFPVRPLWGRVPVDGRWPAAFPLGHREDPRPWRQESEAPDGHTAPHRSSVELHSIGIRVAGDTGRGMMLSGRRAPIRAKNGPTSLR